MSYDLSGVVTEVRVSLASGNLAPVDPPAARYELFHHPNSICSQKVRAVLVHHNLDHASRVVDIATGETYLPSYVRLRLIGCAGIAGSLARSHAGSTSVQTAGCDAAVVPTLVDWATDTVIVDSRRICLYLDDARAGTASLRPADLAARIDEELAIVDDFPNYQLRIGIPPNGRETPVMKLKVGGAGFGLAKVERCRRFIAENATDAALVEAYEAKIAKESQATTELLSPEAMISVYAAVRSTLAKLDRQLAEGKSTWLLSKQFTLADVFWGIQLLRVENLCGDTFWYDGELPAVRRYLTAIRAVRSIHTAVPIGPRGVA